MTHVRIPSPLPEDSEVRKTYPLYSGLLAYFPAALAAVAHHSYKGNQKHNPGQSLHHARGKSDDHEDALLRHIMEGDYEGAAWRALALLQERLEAEGAPLAPGARLPKETNDGEETVQQQEIQFPTTEQVRRDSELITRKLGRAEQHERDFLARWSVGLDPYRHSSGSIQVVEHDKFGNPIRWKCT